MDDTRGALNVPTTSIAKGCNGPSRRSGDSTATSKTWEQLVVHGPDVAKCIVSSLRSAFAHLSMTAGILSLTAYCRRHEYSDIYLHPVGIHHDLPPHHDRAGFDFHLYFYLRHYSIRHLHQCPTCINTSANYHSFCWHDYSVFRNRHHHDDPVWSHNHASLQLCDHGSGHVYERGPRFYRIFDHYGLGSDCNPDAGADHNSPTLDGDVYFDVRNYSYSNPYFGSTSFHKHCDLHVLHNPAGDYNSDINYTW
jgi:hypothetical protein